MPCNRESQARSTRLSLGILTALRIVRVGRLVDVRFLVVQLSSARGLLAHILWTMTSLSNQSFAPHGEGGQDSRGRVLPGSRHDSDCLYDGPRRLFALGSISKVYNVWILGPLVDGGVAFGSEWGSLLLVSAKL